jgi:hypothetical protein
MGVDRRRNQAEEETDQCREDDQAAQTRDEQRCREELRICEPRRTVSQLMQLTPHGTQPLAKSDGEVPEGTN